MMELLLGFAFGFGVMFVVDWAFRFRERAYEAKVMSNAIMLLNDQGFTPHRYLAGMGEDDPDIRHALEVLAFNGYVVLDNNGCVVGRLLPNVEAIKRESPHLTVISSDS